MPVTYVTKHVCTRNKEQYSSLLCVRPAGCRLLFHTIESLIKSLPIVSTPVNKPEEIEAVQQVGNKFQSFSKNTILVSNAVIKPCLADHCLISLAIGLLRQINIDLV